MCGIVGFYGKQNPLSDLVQGLKDLEYRGYDSAGLALKMHTNDIRCIKAKGNVSQLEALLEVQLKQSPDLQYSKPIGIAHTRWSTHGVPDTANAHPHTDAGDDVWLVHNGTVTNYAQLKSNLIAHGVNFYGQTDSEVVAAQIAYFRKTMPMQGAILKTINLLEGTFAFLIIHRFSDSMYAVSNEQPLYMGFADGYKVFASDNTAVVRHTKKVFTFKSGQIIKLTDGNIYLMGFDGQELPFENFAKQTKLIEWDIESASKQGYDTFTHKEICEQPQTIRDTLRYFGGTFSRLDYEEGSVNLGGLIGAKELLIRMNRIILVAEGTSLNACKYAQNLFERMTGLPTDVRTACDFAFSAIPINPNTLVIGVSQSGTTLETIQAIEEAKRKGAYTFGITNVVGSKLSQLVDSGVYLHVGPEIGVASTKAFTAQCIALMQIAIYMGRQRNLTKSDGQKFIRAMEELPSQITEVLELESQIKDLAMQFCHLDALDFLGRGQNQAVAEEAGLKTTELAYIQARGLNAGSMKHGPIAVIEKGYLVIAICPLDEYFQVMSNSINQVSSRGATIIALTSDDVPHVDRADFVLRIPRTRTELYPILNMVALQLFAYWFTVYRSQIGDNSGLKYPDINVDKPRNLAKSVTVA
jgi:glutamine---fructose-6-phosphate transaminase (isomerizing)